MAGYHLESAMNAVHVFRTPNAMPRYYKNKIFVCPAYRKCLHLLQLEHERRNPTPPISQWEHEKLLNKLQRKFK